MEKIKTMVTSTIIIAALVLLATLCNAQLIAKAETFSGKTVPGNHPVASDETVVRNFRINIPESDLAELRRRVLATRWPLKETVKDQSQGVQLMTIKELVTYWGNGYNWKGRS